MKLNKTIFSWRAIFRDWPKRLVIGITVATLVACGPGLSSLGPFTVGGAVTGLSGTVVLQNNGGDNLSLSANGNFTFATKLAKDATYAVTVLTQPTGQICTVSSGSGTATDKAPVVSVDCVTQWTGTKQLGGLGAESSGYSVAVDASGNVYVVGDTSGRLDGNPLVGTNDLFITKYNASGVKQYTKTLGAELATTFGRSVAIDPSGNVYVAGYTNGKLGIDPNVGIYDAFVVKYNSNGDSLYIKQLGVAGAVTAGFSVAVDANLNVYVSGTTSGTLGNSPKKGVADSFVAKYDSNGDLKGTWQLGGGAGTGTAGRSVAVDSSGNVYVAGETSGNLDVNTLTGTTDSFVIKYNSAGILQYCLQRGVASADTYGKSVAVDSRGNVYVAGDSTGGLDGNSSYGFSDYFITKYDNSGAWQFTNQLGAGSETTLGNAVAVDSVGNVYLTGETTGVLYRDPLTGSKDLFVAMFNASGATLYLHQLGVALQATIGQSVAVDASGNAYVVGTTLGGLSGNVLTPGLSYFYVTKYDTNGLKQ
jgi:Beta-propeller repeat